MSDPDPRDLTIALGGRWDARTGKGKALCPAHADDDPSLDIEAKDGRTLWTCRAGCEQATVTAAIKAKAGHLWPERPAALNGARGPGRSGKLGPVVGRYPYRDEHGEVLFWVYRHEPKTFRQHRPDGTPGIAGIRRVLYRLDEVIEAIGAERTVFVVEGEKDADALWGLGIPATCNAGGAGKWRAEYSASLAGADIVILPDNDDTGRAHGQAVAASLKGVVARVRVLELPGLAAKGDASDWLAAGGTAEELWRLAEGAGEAAAGEAAVKKKLLMTFTEFMAAHAQPNYLVDGILQKGFVYSLTGNTGDGKTAIALVLAMAVARGEPFGPHEIEQGRVIYIAKENANDVRNRLIGLTWLKRIGHAELERQFLVIEDLNGIEQDLPRITAEAETFGPVALVIVDTSAATFQGDDENNNPQALAHAKAMRKIADLPGAPTVLVLCHPPKGATTKEQLVPRGGGAFLNEMDGNLTAHGNGDKTANLHWTGKLRGPDFDEIGFRFKTIHSPELADHKGRLMPTVMAELVTDEQAEEERAVRKGQEGALLAAMLAEPDGSLRTWGEACRWDSNLKPAGKKTLTNRVLKRLEKAKLAVKRGEGYELTKAGRNRAEKRDGTDARKAA